MTLALVIGGWIGYQTYNPFLLPNRAELKKHVVKVASAPYFKDICMNKRDWKLPVRDFQKSNPDKVVYEGLTEWTLEDDRNCLKTVVIYFKELRGFPKPPTLGGRKINYSLLSEGPGPNLP